MKAASRSLSLLFLAAMLSGCGIDNAPVSSRELALKGAFSAALSNDARYVVLGSLVHGGSLWNVQTHERLFNWNHAAGVKTPITVSAMSPDGDFAMTVENDGLVLWDTASGRSLTFFTAPTQVLSVALGPGGRYALLGLSDYSAVLFDARKGGIQRMFQHEGRVRSVALSEDGRLALTGAEDRSARLWDVESGKELHRWSHNADVRLVALSRDGSRALSVSKYDRSAVWDTASGSELVVLPAYRSRIVRGETYTAAAFSPDGSQLLTGTTDRRVQLWQLPVGSERAAWLMPRRDGWKRSGAYVMAVGFDPANGEMLSVSADGIIHRLRLPAAR